MRLLIVILTLPLFWAVNSPAIAGEAPAGRPLPSLQSFTGLWDMPTARVLPDWNVRLKYGNSYPYRYYGVALGLFDRLEFHGQFTETRTIEAFVDYDYGKHKDRNAGARLVLVKEDEFRPQIAIGAYDPVGTSKFPSRYLVINKIFSNIDFTIGLGQGLLGGEALDEIDRDTEGETFDTSFLFSDPRRQTKLFGGIEYHYNSKLTLSAEYSSLKYEGMFGSPAKAKWPVNLGIKYQPAKHLFLQGGYMRGQEWSFGLSADFPLEPEGILPWKKEASYTATEKNRWQAHKADNQQLAKLLATELSKDGFLGITASVNDKEVWIEFVNGKYHSHAKAFGRVARVLDTLAPQRITTFYLNLTSQGQIIQSMKSGREEIRAFLDHKLDKDDFLEFANLSQYNSTQQYSFFSDTDNLQTYQPSLNWLDYYIDLKVRTFLNNKAGFFKHKVFLRPQVYLYPWKNSFLQGEVQFTLFNEWDDVIYEPLEPEPARTDLVLYEEESRPRISVLAFNQHCPLPLNVLGRFSAGYFESAYAGIGGEIFRFFKDGRFGIGAEAELVRKRDPQDNFKLSDDITKTYKTYYLNLYGQLWPSLGLDAGLKIGQFLAEDVGVRAELRRSFKYFTIGAWYTHTNTDHMVSPDNRGNREKGVYIRIPLSLFTDRDRRGSLAYAFSSFTRDPGQSVRQPSLLYPMNPYKSVNHTRTQIEDMRR